MTTPLPFALVLGGGGTKGAYQIGAWRAFRELGVSFNAIAGASVGALNAGLIAQGSYDLGLEIWNDIALEDIVSLPPDLLERRERENEQDRLPTFSEISGYLLKNHGLDARPLRTLLRAHIDEEKIRTSRIDLGLTTYELTNMRQVEIFLEDIPAGQLPDYLLASASFPAFRSTEIEGRRFTDGGIVDNIPYRMIKNRGYRGIIVVDVSGLGLNRRPDVVGTQTVYLKNSIEMGGILDFDRDFITTFMELGYLDSLRAFGQLGGIHYFIEDGPNDAALLRGLNEVLESREMAATLDELVGGDGGPNDDPGLRTRTRAVRATIPREMRDYREIVIPLAECAALSLDLERVSRYTLEGLIREIRRSRTEVEHGDLDSARRLSYRTILDLIKRKWSLLNHRETETSTMPYLYDRAFDVIGEKGRRTVYLSALRRLYPALVPARIFFAVLDRYFGSS